MRFLIFLCISIREGRCFGKERSSNFETFVICSSILRERNFGRKSNLQRGRKNNDGFLEKNTFEILNIFVYFYTRGEIL